VPWDASTSADSCFILMLVWRRQAPSAKEQSKNMDQILDTLVCYVQIQKNAAIWFKRLWTEYTTQALEVWIDPVHLYILVCVTSIYTLHNKQSITHFKGLKLLSVDTERGYNFSKWLCYTYTLAIDCSVCSAWQFHCLVSAFCTNWGNHLALLQTILLYFFIFVNSMRCLSFM